MFPRGKKFIVSAFTAVMVAGLLIGAGAAGGDVDPTFNSQGGTGANGTGHAIMVQPDGKVLIGGYFTIVNGSLVVRDGLTRLLAAPPNTAPIASAPSSSKGSTCFASTRWASTACPSTRRSSRT